MKAVEIHAPYGFEGLRLIDRSEPPSPGPGQILVKVRAVSMNHRDLLVMRGQGAWRPPEGRIPGSDAVGDVVAVGSGVTRFKVGDRTLSTILPHWIDGPLTSEKVVGSLGGAGADGVFAELVLLNAESVVKPPRYLDDIEASTLPCAALTAWQALSRAGSLTSQKTLLVQGTGGVSLFALQLAIAAGAQVIATSSSEHKLARLSALGAGHTINYKSNPEWDEQVRELTRGLGVDHTIDIGGSNTLARSISAVRFEGVVSIVGLTTGLKAEIDLFPVFLKNIRIDGVETGSRSMLEAMLKWMEDRKIHPIIDKVFPVEDVHWAYRHLASGSHFGKVCISF